MHLRVFIIWILPLLCHSKIRINIAVASKIQDATVSWSGEDNKVVAHHEKDLFNITTSNLNRGMRVELGKVPDGIFLKDPTTYGDLFKKFKWPEARRNLRVEKAEVIEVINAKVALNTHEHINNSSDTVKARRRLFESVESTAYSAWPIDGLPTEDLFYDIAIDFGSKIFEYENKWRNHTLRSTFVKVGQYKKGFVSIKPGQTVVTKLIAFKTVLTVEVKYKAQIVGNLIGDYENLYGKYHFWSPTMGNIMRAANMKNEIKTTELIEIVCYTNPKLEVYDKDTGLTLKSDGPKRLFSKLKRNKL